MTNTGYVGTEENAQAVWQVGKNTSPAKYRHQVVLEYVAKQPCAIIGRVHGVESEGAGQL